MIPCDCRWSRGKFGLIRIYTYITTEMSTLRYFCLLFLRPFSYTCINSFSTSSLDHVKTFLVPFFQIAISLSAIVIRIMYNSYFSSYSSWLCVLLLIPIYKVSPSPYQPRLLLKCLLWYLHLQSFGHVFVQFNIYISTDLSNNFVYNFFLSSVFWESPLNPYSTKK